jgi:hypothetical protein
MICTRSIFGSFFNTIVGKWIRGSAMAVNNLLQGSHYLSLESMNGSQKVSIFLFGRIQLYVCVVNSVLAFLLEAFAFQVLK